MAPVKELALIEQPSAAVQLFERLATDPNASVEKIERLMALWERGEAKTAEKAFFAAMAEAQKEMRPVREDASNPQTRSRYASYEALDRALRHPLPKSGMRSEQPVERRVEVEEHRSTGGRVVHHPVERRHDDGGVDLGVVREERAEFAESHGRVVRPVVPRK